MFESCRFTTPLNASTPMRLLFVALLLFLSAVPAICAQAKPASPAPSPASMGQWSAPVNFCPTQPCVIGADAAVLYTGQVLFYYFPANNTQNSQAVLLDPVTRIVINVA